MNDFSGFPGDIPADEMAEYVRLYVEETGEQLDQLVQVLLLLEADPADARHLNEAFRLIHSVKGSSAMLGLDRITTLTHHMETHFERLRSGQRAFDAATLDVVLQCIDFLRDCNERIRHSEPLPSAGELLDEVKALEQQTRSGRGPIVRTTVPATRSAGESGEHDVTDPGPPAPGTIDPPPQSDVARELQVTVRFRPSLAMVELKAELVLARLAGVGMVVDCRPAPREWATADGLSQIVVRLRSGQSPTAVVTAADADGVVAVEIQEIAADERPAVDATPSAPPSASVVSAASTTNETVRVDVRRLDALLNLAGELIVSRARFSRLAADLAPTFRKSGLAGRTAALAEAVVGAIHDVQADTEDDDERWSGLEEQAGALGEQARLLADGRRHFGRLVEAIDEFARVSESLQRGVLETRMVPVGPLFGRFRRSVRDIAADLGKKVTLELHGEATELDKRMIDELGDPLVHLVRNAIDHGIETADVRVGRGKSETAIVRLEAMHQGNHVVITIRDDGGGIDTRRIRQRAIERGLVSVEEAGLLGPEELIDFIWHPGFSTKEQVSDISGRGVGMDIVRTRITALGGSIEVASDEGVGATFTIRLPLTLAIARCMLFQVPQGVFAVPVADVREIVTAAGRHVVTVHGRRSCEIRGAFVPLVEIDEIFSWSVDGAAPTSRTIGGQLLVLQAANRSIALCVDGMLGGEDIVVKSLADNFLHIRGLGGASILGDGSVCLLVDVAAVIDLATRQSRGGGMRTATEPSGGGGTG